MRWGCLLVLATLPAGPGLCGCARQRADVYLAPPVACPEAIVFGVDGAGNFQAASIFLKKLVAEERAPVQVETVEWSHGFCRIVADQTDYAHGRAEGLKLAARITAFHQEHPGVRIYLLSHSAGTFIAVSALEYLPPETVDRVVLLNPSLSAVYDLRPALRAVKKSMDVFFSPKDYLYLGVALRLLGTSDRRWTTPGGRAGFRSYGEGPEDQALYAKLRQHPWHPSDRALGNFGGHFGTYQPEFVRAYILPLFLERKIYGE